MIISYSKTICSQRWTTVPMLEGRFGNDVVVKNGDDNGVKNNIDKILNAISAEPKATQKRIAEVTGLSTRTISREIKELRDTGVILRIGSDRS